MRISDWSSDVCSSDLNAEALAQIAAYSSIPIATGERMFSRWDFKHMLHDGHVEIIQPDLSHAGGISAVMRIAAMAKAYDVALAPHCPLGSKSLAAADRKSTRLNSSH